MVEGRSAHQAPETDGLTTLHGVEDPKVGQFWRATVVASEGVDLIAEALEQVRPLRTAGAEAPGAGE